MPIASIIANLLMVSLLVLEMLLRHRAPRALAHLARIPFNPPRVLPLSPAAIQGLSEEASVASDYRTAPEKHLALARLPGESEVEIDGIRLLFAPARGSVVAVHGSNLRKRGGRPLLFVALRAEGDRIVLSSRFHPSNILHLMPLGAVGPWYLARHSAAAGVVFAVALIPFIVLSLVLLFRERTAVGPLADAVEAEVATRIRRLTKRVPHSRVAIDEAEELDGEPAPDTSVRARTSR